MRYNDFGNFFDGYISKGFVVGAVCILLGLVFGALFFDIRQSGLKKENMLYLAIQGKEVENSTVKEAAELIMSMVTKRDKDSLIEHLLVVEKLEELGGTNNFYLKLIFNKKGKIISLAQGKIKPSELLVKTTEWRVFWSWWSILSILILILACTINLCWETFDDGESLFLWPWNKWWVYPSILLLSLVLIPAMAIEIAVRVIVFIIKKIVKFFNQAVDFSFRNRSKTKAERQKVRKLSLELEEKKQVAFKMIEEIKKGSSAAKTKWSKIYLYDVEKRTWKLRERVDQLRLYLSELGQKIGSVQKDLAESQRQLSEWEKTLEQQKNKKQEDCFRDFDQLLSLPHVEAIEITDEQLRIYTDVIHIDYGFRKRYEIGIFVIKIELDYDNVSLENLSSTHPNGYYHPYVVGNIFCWGALSGPISQALHRKEYFVAVQYILQAMQSAEGDNRSKVTEWKGV